MKKILLIGSSSGLGLSLKNSSPKNIELVCTNRDTVGSLSLDLVSKNSIDEFVLHNDTVFTGVIITAGISHFSKACENSRFNLDEEIGVSLTNQIYLVSKLLEKKMVDEFICVTSSINSRFFTPGLSVYCAIKAALNAYIESCNNEYINSPLRFISLQVPSLDTGMSHDKELTEAISKYTKDEMKQKLIDPVLYTQWVWEKVLSKETRGLLMTKEVKKMYFLDKVIPGFQKKLFKKLFKFSHE